jgi:hypothetical protein
MRSQHDSNGQEGRSAGTEPAYDLFVSYAHADNAVPVLAEAGWVSTLVRQLTVSLNLKLLRGAPRVWMDESLASNQPLSATLRGHASRSHALLVVLSPGYLRSDWCRRELDEFVAAARFRGATDSIFVIETVPMDKVRAVSAGANILPEPIRELVPIEFWEMDPVGGHPRLSGFPMPDPKEHSHYWRQINRLSSELQQHLDRAHAQSFPPASAPMLPPMREAALATVPVMSSVSESAVEPAEGSSDALGLSLFLHAAPEDQATARIIASQLDAVGATVVLPQPQPGQQFEDCLRQHEDQLRLCQGILLLNVGDRTANLTVAWQVVRRVYGVRPTRCLGAALHLPPPGRRRLAIHNVLDIDCSEGFRMEAMRPFFASLRAASASWPGPHGAAS